MKAINLMIFTLLISTVSVPAFARGGLEGKNIEAEDCESPTQECFKNRSNHVCSTPYGDCKKEAIQKASILDGVTPTPTKEEKGSI